MHEVIDRASDMVKTWMSMTQLVTDAQFVVAMRLMGLSGTWHLPDSEPAAMVAVTAVATGERRRGRRSLVGLFSRRASSVMG